MLDIKAICLIAQFRHTVIMRAENMPRVMQEAVTDKWWRVRADDLILCTVSLFCTVPVTRSSTTLTGESCPPLAGDTGSVSLWAPMQFTNPTRVCALPLSSQRFPSESASLRTTRNQEIRPTRLQNKWNNTVCKWTSHWHRASKVLLYHRRIYYKKRKHNSK